MDPDGNGEVGRGVGAGGADHVEVQTILREGIAGIVAAVANAVGWVGGREGGVVPCGIQGLGDLEALCRLCLQLSVSMWSQKELS